MILNSREFLSVSCLSHYIISPQFVTFVFCDYRLDSAFVSILYFAFYCMISPWYSIHNYFYLCIQDDYFTKSLTSSICCFFFQLLPLYCQSLCVCFNEIVYAWNFIFHFLHFIILFRKVVLNIIT